MKFANTLNTIVVAAQNAATWLRTVTAAVTATIRATNADVCQMNTAMATIQAAMVTAPVISTTSIASEVKMQSREEFIQDWNDYAKDQQAVGKRFFSDCSDSVYFEMLCKEFGIKKDTEVYNEFGKFWDIHAGFHNFDKVNKDKMYDFLKQILKVPEEQIQLL